MQLGLLGNGAHPETGESVAFRLDDRFGDVHKWGPRALIGDLQTARDAVQRPYRVFRDLLRESMNDGFAVITKPEKRYVDMSNSVDAPPRSLFIVYIDRGMTIFDLGWIDLDLEFPDLPSDEAEEEYVSTNFGREIRHD